MNDVLDRVGSPDRYTNDSVFGSSSTALSTMYCQGDGRPCDREFLDAIESLQVARTNALEARSEFRDVQTHAEDCDVSEPDLFIEEAQSGVEITEKLHEAVNSFIESAKRHVDEERESFSRGQSFREGMSTYVEAQEIGLMAPEELHDRVTVYNG